MTETLTGMAATGRLSGWASRINEAESSVTFTKFSGNRPERVTVTLNADGTLTPKDMR